MLLPAKDTRNSLIFGLFERVHMVEQIGSGIPRIKKAMLECNLPAPEFKIDGLFTLTLKRNVLSKTREKIINLIKENPKITMREIAYKIGFTAKGVECHISRMKSENILKRDLYRFEDLIKQ